MGEGQLYTVLGERWDWDPQKNGHQSGSASTPQWALTEGEAGPSLLVTPSVVGLWNLFSSPLVTVVTPMVLLLGWPAPWPRVFGPAAGHPGCRGAWGQLLPSLPSVSLSLSFYSSPITTHLFQSLSTIPLKTVARILGQQWEDLAFGSSSATK